MQLSGPTPELLLDTIPWGNDADGRQVTQTSAGVTTKHLWDERSLNGDIVTETDASGAVTASYTLDGQGTLLAETQGSGSGFAGVRAVRYIMRR